MKHGSLFSGIGGFDLAAEWMGWENIFHCEWNQFGQKVLKHYWPDAISYTDITKTDFSIHRGGIDIVTGGFPCQPFSAAGKRKGTEDNRYLWPEMLRAIKEIQPAFVVAENVHGIINQGRGLVFEQVQADLENEGYQVQSYLLPACAKNAPHRRDRFWFVAYSPVYSCKYGIRNAGHETQPLQEKRFNEFKPTSNSGSINSTIPIQQRGQVKAENINVNRSGESRNVTNTNGGIGCKGGLHKTERKEAKRYISPFDTLNNERGAWHNFPTQSPLCSRNDGLLTGLVGITISKHRVESIKAYGNSIVPQVAFEIFKAIEQNNTRLNAQ